MINTQLKEQPSITPFESNAWAKSRFEIKSVCNKNWTEEEIHLYECKALSSWESR